MQHRTVAEFMTRDVVKARRDLPFKEIVRLLAENDVTAVPVVDDLDRPMGVVSEADLLRKSADQADLSGRVPVPHLEAGERAKAEGSRAEELMSAPAVCARPEWSVVEAARLMETQHVKRLPIDARYPAGSSGRPFFPKWTRLVCATIVLTRPRHYEGDGRRAFAVTRPPAQRP